MPLYMTQTKYSQDSLQAMADHPSNRSERMSQVVESFGGQLLHFYWVLGDCDTITIYEAPDNQSAMSILLTLSRGRSVDFHKTYALMSNGEAMAGMENAMTIETGYTSPLAEWEGWQEDVGGEG